MVFTERQKSELKKLIKETSKDIIKELLCDKHFIDSLVDKLADKVSEKIDNEIEKLSEQITDIRQTIDGIQAEQDEVRLRVADLEQDSKQGQLRLYGLPEDNEGDLTKQVVDVFERKMGVEGAVVNRCYRIGPKKAGRARAVLIKFDSLRQRDLVFYNKKKLKGTKLVVAEELVKSRYELLLYAKEKLGRDKVWTAGGKIFTKVNGSKKLLRSSDEVLKIKS